MNSLLRAAETWILEDSIQTMVQSQEPPAIPDSQVLWTGQVATTRRDVLNAAGVGESKDAREYLVFLKVKEHQLGPTFPQVLKCSMLVCMEYKVHIKRL